MYGQKEAGRKKIRLSDEIVYILGAVILSLATAMLSAADFGLSVIVSPAYLVSLKVPYLTFGQAEYVVQGILFLIFCAVMRQIRPLYFGAFLSGVIYGFILDLWRYMIPHFNPDMYAPGTLSMALRVCYFVIGFFINAFGAGTLLMACCNGPLIGVYSRWFDRHFEVGNGCGVSL